jgi:cellulose synthase operon protein C
MPESMTVTTDVLDTIRDLYERGLYVQACGIGSEEYGPLDSWPGTAGRVAAGRLAHQLGAPRRAQWLIRRAWRDDPGDAEASYYYAYTVLERQGPYRAWRFLAERGELSEASPAVRASWYALRATIAGSLRDFEAAETWLARADEAEPDSAWVAVARSSVLQSEDRYDEALAAARRGLELQPWYRPAVQATGHLLTLRDRDGEALELLREAAWRIESAAVAWQLLALQMEYEQFQEAAATLERYVELSPLLDSRATKALNAVRSDIAYGLGDLEAALEHARQAEGGFHEEMVHRLSDPSRADGQRVLLPVGFVRQHHVTCVPATLTTISRFWSMPAEHLQVAEEICYNGTSAHSERTWAEDHGWFAREFTVTPESLEALIDRGAPFTLTTINPGNAHLQAVVGYDTRRGTMLIRDPYVRNIVEALCDKFLERYAAFGPRGMVLVPAAERSRIDSLDLPDAEAWDRLHRLDGALVAHRRDEAQQVHDELHSVLPGHRLTRHARWRLAIYDADPVKMLAAVENLLEVQPDNECLQSSRLSYLRDLSRREERIETYARLCGKPDVNPLFLQQYAQELMVDAREHERAIHLLRRAMRRAPFDAVNYSLLADLYWDQRRFEEALELYRFATSLNDKDEQLARAFFGAAQHLRQTDAALEFLDQRFRRFGKQSSLPARTLDWAWSRLERTRDALRVIDEAVALRPDDGELLLYAADAHAGATSESLERAQQFLQQAEGRSARQAWLRTAARLASYRAEPAEARRLWQDVLRLQPLAIDAHSAVAQLLAETAGRAAALAHLRQAADAFPHHHPLHVLWIQWLQAEPPEVREPVVRRVVELNPADAWAQRELGFVLAAQRRIGEAWQVCAVAERLDPTSPSLHHLRGELLALEDRRSEARAAYREAIRLSVDNNHAIAQLMQLCDTPAERREALAFIKDELVAQVIYGDGLLAYRNFAFDTLDPEELLAMLREALQARPDLWHAWSAIIQQLLGMDQLDAAHELAVQATERFPLLPRLWFDRALVSRARLDWDDELAALETAYRINPGWGTSVRALCEVQRRNGHLERARELLEQALVRDPLDVVNRGMLAEVLWKLGERQAALDDVAHAVELEPGYDWAWNALRQWSTELEQPQRPIDIARRLTEIRAGEPRSWLILARTLSGPEALEERLAALDRAVELNPRCADAWDIRAVLLFREGRIAEARAACRPHVWNEHPPVELRTREAWIEAEQGRTAEAVSLLKAALADDPAYYNGWLRLAEWCQTLEDHEGCLAAARMMVRSDPQNELSLGWLADALHRTGQRDVARQAFARAFELSPEYDFAGLSLADMQLEDGDLGDARETLATLERHAPSLFVEARVVQLAARTGDRDRASAGLRTIATTPQDNHWPLHAALDAIVKAGWRRQAIAILGTALDAPVVDAEAGSLWIRLQIDDRHWDCDSRLESLLQKGEVGRRAVYAWLECLAHKGRAWHLRSWIRRNAGWLRRETFTWGSAGYALATIRAFRQAVRWMADWRERPDAEPWMLVNLIEGLRAQRRRADALEVSQHALSLPEDNGSNLHRLWLAADDALAGRTQAAREVIASIDPAPLHADYQFLHRLTSAVISAADAASADVEERRKAFRRAGQAVAQAVLDYRALPLEPARRRFYRACLRRIARDTAVWQAQFWCWFRLLGS